MTLAQVVLLLERHNEIHRPPDEPGQRPAGKAVRGPKLGTPADLLALASMRRE